MPQLANPTEHQDPIDESVVLDAKAGDYRAANRVLVAFLPRMRRIINRFKGLPQVVREDLRTEAILALYRAIKTWDPEKISAKGERVGFTPYAYNLMRTTVMRELNKTRGKGVGGKRRAPKMVYLDKPILDDTTHMDLPSGGPTPEEELFRREEQAKGLTWKAILVKYIENMPGRDGELLRGRFIQGLSNDELAAQFGVSEGSIRNWLDSALAKVRTDIEDQLNEARIDPNEIVTYLSARKPHAD
jgi:RNA polymerase sigma factor (sigma-70 family)